MILSVGIKYSLRDLFFDVNNYAWPITYDVTSTVSISFAISEARKDGRRSAVKWFSYERAFYVQFVIFYRTGRKRQTRLWWCLIKRGDLSVSIGSPVSRGSPAPRHCSECVFSCAAFQLQLQFQFPSSFKLRAQLKWNWSETETKQFQNGSERVLKLFCLSQKKTLRQSRAVTAGVSKLFCFSIISIVQTILLFLCAILFLFTMKMVLVIHKRL